METWNRLTGARGENGGKKGKGSKNCRNDPHTWTMVWGLTVGAGGSWVEEGKGGKTGTTLIE